MAFLGHLLSVGTGDGLVSVWDRRAGKYLDSPAAHLSDTAVEAPSAVPGFFTAASEDLSPKPLALELAGGFLERNEIYM